jgi:hypothetical protein
MGLYAAGTAPGMYPGDTVVLSNASLGGANATQAVAPCGSIGGNPINLTIVNQSAATLTVQTAAVDANANYEPLSGVTVPATSSVSFSTTAPFVRVLPGSDPGTGVITICR